MLNTYTYIGREYSTDHYDCECNLTFVLTSCFRNVLDMARITAPQAAVKCRLLFLTLTVFIFSKLFKLV